MKKFLFALLFVASSAFATPSQKEIADAASHHDYARAEMLMQQVIHDKPNSSKAHYVYSQILHNEHKDDKAREELATAKALDPNMSYTSQANVEQYAADLTRNAGQVATQTTTTTTVVEHHRQRADLSGLVYLFYFFSFAVIAWGVIVLISQAFKSKKETVVVRETVPVYVNSGGSSSVGRSVYNDIPNTAPSPIVERHHYHDTPVYHGSSGGVGGPYIGSGGVGGTGTAMAAGAALGAVGGLVAGAALERSLENAGHSHHRGSYYDNSRDWDDDVTTTTTTTTTSSYRDDTPSRIDFGNTNDWGSSSSSSSDWGSSSSSDSYSSSSSSDWDN